MGDDAREILRRLGLDIDRDSVHATFDHLGLPPPSPGKDPQAWAHEAMRRLADVPKDRDPWATGGNVLEEPFHGAIPVEFLGDLDLDPLEFAVELARAASWAELEDLRLALDVLGRRESGDDADHVSNWSPPTAGRLPTTRQAIVRWHYDAAMAGPATIRRLIEGTLNAVEELGLPGVRLLIGHID